MAKKAKAKKRVVKVAKPVAVKAVKVEQPARKTVAEQVNAVRASIDSLREKVSTGSKSEIDLVPVALGEISAKLGEIR